MSPPPPTANASDGEQATQIAGGGAPARSRVESDGDQHGLRPGDSIGRNLVLSVLGEGGMGQVYEAFDPDLDRRLAIKLMHSTVTPVDGPNSSKHSQHERARLIAEAQAIAKIAHPNVVTIYDVGAFEDQVFMAMELIEGQTLRGWAESKSRSWRNVLEIMLQAGEGLLAVHRSGLIHRDFKPDNVLVGHNGQVCIADFGLASGSVYADSGFTHLDDASVAQLSADSDGLSKWSIRAGTIGSRAQASTAFTGIRSGTPGYMAPEMHLGIACDVLSDQFAFCVSLFEVLVGHRPFRGPSPQKLVAQIQGRKLRGHRDDLAHLPSWLRALILTGLSPEPSNRHASLAVLLATIRHHLDAPRRRRRFARQLAAGFAATLAAGMIAVPVLGNQPPSCRRVAEFDPSAWGPKARDELEARFTASGLSYAAQTLHRVERGLDAYARDWSDARETVCDLERTHRDAGLVDHRQIELQRDCLQRATDAVSGLVQSLKSADRRQIAKAITAVFELPDLDRCLDAERLKTQEPHPSPEDAPQVADMRAQLASLAAQKGGDSHEQNIEKTHELLNHARQQVPDFPALQAEIELTLARLYVDAMRVPEAIEYCRRALTNARAGRHDELAVRAILLLTYCDGYHRQNNAAVPELNAETEALISSIGHPIEYEAEYARTRGLISLPHEDDAERLEFSRRALALREELFGRDHPAVAVAMMNYGITLMENRQVDRSIAMYESALEVQERVFGDSHPQLALSLVNLGASYRREQGRFLDALAAHRRAAEIFESVYGPVTPGCVPGYNEVTHSSREAGELVEAREHAQTYQELQAKIGHPGHRSADWAGTHLARIDLAAGYPVGPLSTLKVRRRKPGRSAAVAASASPRHC